MSNAIELTGTVEDVFGHRFTLAAEGGKYLIDLGPHGEAGQAIEAGQTVAVKGDKKPGEVKAASLRLGDGDWLEIKRPEKDPAPRPEGPEVRAETGKPAPQPAGKDEEGEIGDDDVTRALDENGYTDAGEPVRKPKHIEIEATKDGARHVVHVHKGGVVKKAEPVG